SLSMPSMSNLHWCREVLVRACQVGASENIPDDFALQGLGEVTAFTSERTRAVTVARDGWEVPIGIVEGSEHLGSIRDKELLPDGAFVLLADSEGVGLESLGLSQVGELLIVETSGGAKWPRSHDVASGRVFIGEAAFEGHHHVAAVFDVVGNPLEHGIGGAIQRRHEY